MNDLQILRRPIITEKSLALSAQGKYTFEVDPKARKSTIAQAVEQAFGVHALEVKTIIRKGKRRRFGAKRKQIITSLTKKAIVQLQPGEKIEVFSAGEGKGA